MIYLLGINHSVQCNKEADQSKRFASFLSKNIPELDIAFVGEEWSIDASRKWSIQTTTVEDVINELRHEGCKIETKYCDPDLAEQERLGIPTPAEVALAIGSSLKA